MQSNSIQIHPVGGAVGAEIVGVDLSEPLTTTVRDTIRHTLADRGVVFFRDQSLTPEQHIGLARQFGDININRFFTHAEGYPEIALVVKEPHQTRNIGGGWHTDHSYDQIPALGSILYAREVPPTGGDTLFSGMYAAYDALSDGLKRTLSSLRGVHSSRHVFGVARPDMQDRYRNPEAAVQDAVHPAVITHPESGRKALYVNPGFTLRFDGWTSEESRPLLDYLYRHAVKPEFGCRFVWRNGSIAFWDNRSTWHYAVNDYQGERRLMHRITVEGCELAG
ncbi:TauD/TfdA family dioxygenase [Acidisphaera sp. S103]|uniref:TauD/TfdA dioxygenase family protein n=1 Tax=Acidisphaera sp. S103 TaxID=1747223 RepID=UPI00131EBAD0|nr:TauD/TfdA family dioxygenase [Acidisphaera sp. S103]